MRRILRRVVLSGSISDSVGVTLTQEQQNTAITIAHEAYAEADSRIQDLINERLDTLGHEDVCKKTLEKIRKKLHIRGHDNHKAAPFREKQLLSYPFNVSE